MKNKNYSQRADITTIRNGEKIVLRTYLSNTGKAKQSAQRWIKQYPYKFPVEIEIS